MRTIALVLGVFVLRAGVVAAQAPAAPSAPVTIGSVVVSGSLRTRVEGWSWFQGVADGDYVYSGSIARLSLRESRKRVDWQVELAAPFLLGLPGGAIAPGAQGQFGLGAAYYAANDGHRNTANLFLKQVIVRLTNLGGRSGQALTLGRFEVADGAEMVPANATLAAVKRDRITQRLLGPFGFSHVGRSFDGVQYSSGGSRVNVTALAGRPTRGTFQVNGWGELDVNVFYGAITGQAPRRSAATEWRAFALAYGDYRDEVLKTDNRPVAVRRADSSDLNIFTFGGHYLAAIPAGKGTVDVLLWGAGQTGSWGALSHRAAAFAAEAGWQPAGIPLRPWVRGGWNAGSGDSDPADDRHGTFFQVLPTPRVYARFPFFNLMNSSDAFGELVLRPTPRVTTRFDAHALRLSTAGDLWYQGGGAFQPSTFGYAGRPSNGATGLATLVDLSAEYAAGPHAAVGGYYAFARGGSVIERTFPASANARLGYVELTLRF